VLNASSPLKDHFPRHPDDTLKRQPMPNHSQCCADRAANRWPWGAPA